MTINIAIAGIGTVAETHASAIGDSEGAELVAGSCRTESKGRAFADEFDCEWYAETEAMLEATNIDAVSVCTPSGTHADVVTEVAQAGAHVLCEKNRRTCRRTSTRRSTCGRSFVRTRPRSTELVSSSG